MSEPRLPSRCCQGFVLPAHPQDEGLRSWFRRKLATLREVVAEGSMGGRDESVRIIDDLRTAQLVVPLALADLSPLLRATLDYGILQVLENGDLIWGCKYHDPDTGACGIYKHRPTMCRVFPGNDTNNREGGHNVLCLRCSSTYCKHHPENPHGHRRH